jgi:hypothetical protein
VTAGSAVIEGCVFEAEERSLLRSFGLEEGMVLFLVIVLL